MPNQCPLQNGVRDGSLAGFKHQLSETRQFGSDNHGCGLRGNVPDTNAGATCGQNNIILS